MDPLPGGDPPGVALSSNLRPEHPRPPMTFEEQAKLLEYFHGRINLEDGQVSITTDLGDRTFLDDLWLTAQRLRRMAGHEDAVRKLVMGR